MKPLAIIIFTVTSGAGEGKQYGLVDHCSISVLETNLAFLDLIDEPAIAQCYYGNGPLTSPRPTARGE